MQARDIDILGTSGISGYFLWSRLFSSCWLYYDKGLISFTFWSVVLAGKGLVSFSY